MICYRGKHKWARAGTLRDAKLLKKEIEALIREKLIFRANVEVVPKDSLPKYEYKAKLVRKVL